jgi:hypothetical protein
MFQPQTQNHLVAWWPVMFCDQAFQAFNTHKHTMKIPFWQILLCTTRNLLRSLVAKCDKVSYARTAELGKTKVGYEPKWLWQTESSAKRHLKQGWRYNKNTETFLELTLKL